MAKKTKQQTTKKQITKQENITMAFLAYILFFIPLLTEAKDDDFVKYHVKQGLGLFICEFVVAFVSKIPLLGWALSPFLALGILVLFVIGIMNALSGKKEPLPLIGKFSEKFNL